MDSKEFNTWKPMPIPPKKDRPTCKCCGKPRTINIDRDTTGHKPGDGWTYKHFPAKRWQYNGYGHFCTQSCAVAWANAIADSIVKGETKLTKVN